MTTRRAKKSSLPRSPVRAAGVIVDEEKIGFRERRASAVRVSQPRLIRASTSQHSTPPRDGSIARGTGRPVRLACS